MAADSRLIAGFSFHTQIVFRRVIENPNWKADFNFCGELAVECGEVKGRKLEVQGMVFYPGMVMRFKLLPEAVLMPCNFISI